MPLSWLLVWILHQSSGSDVSAILAADWSTPWNKSMYNKCTIKKGQTAYCAYSLHTMGRNWCRQSEEFVKLEDTIVIPNSKLYSKQHESLTKVLWGLGSELASSVSLCTCSALGSSFQESTWVPLRYTLSGTWLWRRVLSEGEMWVLSAVTGSGWLTGVV